MHQTSSCPKCNRLVSLPSDVDRLAMVRCPLCQVKFPLHEAHDHTPPLLQVVPLGADEEHLVHPADDLTAWPAHGHAAMEHRPEHVSSNEIGDVAHAAVTHPVSHVADLIHDAILPHAAIESLDMAHHATEHLTTAHLTPEHFSVEHPATAEPAIDDWFSEPAAPHDAHLAPHDSHYATHEVHDLAHGTHLAEPHPLVEPHHDEFAPLTDDFASHEHAEHHPHELLGEHDLAGLPPHADEHLAPLNAETFGHESNEWGEADDLAEPVDAFGEELADGEMHAAEMHAEDEGFAMAGALNRPVNPQVNDAITKSQTPVAKKKRPRRPDEGGSAVGKMISAVMGLVLAVAFVVPIYWWFTRTDLAGASKYVPDFLSFILPPELKKKLPIADTKSLAQNPNNTVDPGKIDPVMPNEDNKPGNTDTPPDPAETTPKPDPTDKPTDNATEKPAENPLEKPLDKPVDKPLDKPADPFETPKPTVDPLDVPKAPDPPKPPDVPTPPVVVKEMPVGPKTPPQFTSAELGEALKAANDSGKEYAEALQSGDAAMEKGKRGGFLRKLYTLGERVTFVTETADDPSVAQRKDAIQKVVMQAGDATKLVPVFGKNAAIWINHASRKPTETGIVVGGTVTEIEKREGLFITKLSLAGELPEGMQKDYVIVSKMRLPHVGELAPALIFGAIIDNPAETIDGFTGTETRVIWSNFAINLSSDDPGANPFGDPATPK